MKTFIIKILVFISPVLLLIIITSLFLDPFKVFNEYNNYYDQGFVSLNRDMVCTKTYNRFRKMENFNSFVFGSSRSLAYQLNDWKKYLSDDAKPFHYDANGEGLFGVCKKIQYIDELGDSIKNALIIVDRDLLSTVENQKGHLLITSPEISKESRINYYFTFIRASLKFQFFIAYIDYTMFKKYRKYMGFLIFELKSPSIYDPVNCNMYFGKELEISKDSLGYYNELVEKGIFYHRPRVIIDKMKITDQQKIQLNIIKTIFKKHQTNYKIVISPLYDQISLEEDQLALLIDIFGNENVFDFSGVNNLTQPIYNYYESNHYRVHVTKEIFENIYK